MKNIIGNNFLDRWSYKKKSLIDLIIDKAFHKNDFSVSPFGIVNEKIDFRGYDFSLLSELKNINFIGYDFSFSSFENVWIENCRFENVIFDNAKLDEFSDHGNCFVNCSFKGASFTSAGIGYKGTLYEKCLFENSSFKKTIFISAKYRQCRFSFARLNNIDFNASSFEDCIFEGVLSNVLFCNGFRFPDDNNKFGVAEPNTMKNVSFSKADLIGVDFIGGVDLSSIDPPNLNTHRFYNDWNYRLNRLIDKSRVWIDDEKREVDIFIASCIENSNKQNYYIINIGEMCNSFGVGVANKMIHILDAAKTLKGS